MQALLLYQTKFLDKGPASLLVFPNFVSNRETGTQVLVVYATLAKGGKGAEKELQELMEPFEALGPAVSGIIRMPWANMSRVSVRSGGQWVVVGGVGCGRCLSEGG